MTEDNKFYVDNVVRLHSVLTLSMPEQHVTSTGKRNVHL